MGKHHQRILIHKGSCKRLAKDVVAEVLKKCSPSGLLSLAACAFHMCEKKRPMPVMLASSDDGISSCCTSCDIAK